MITDVRVEAAKIYLHIRTLSFLKPKSHDGSNAAVNRCGCGKAYHNRFTEKTSDVYRAEVITADNKNEFEEREI